MASSEREPLLHKYILLHEEHDSGKIESGIPSLILRQQLKFNSGSCDGFCIPLKTVNPQFAELLLCTKDNTVKDRQSAYPLDTG